MGVYVPLATSIISPGDDDVTATLIEQKGLDEEPSPTLGQFVASTYFVPNSADEFGNKINIGAIKTKNNENATRFAFI